MARSCYIHHSTPIPSPHAMSIPTARFCQDLSLYPTFFSSVVLAVILPPPLLPASIHVPPSQRCALRRDILRILLKAPSSTSYTEYFLHSSAGPGVRRVESWAKRKKRGVAASLVSIESETRLDQQKRHSMAADGKRDTEIREQDSASEKEIKKQITRTTNLRRKEKKRKEKGNETPRNANRPGSARHHKTN